MSQAAIYCRYSSNNQKEISIEGQLRENLAYCEKNNFEVVATYADRAKSGRYETREDFQRMVSDASHKKFDYIVVYKLSRFFRNRAESALYRKQLRGYGVQLLSATEQIPTGRGGIFYEAILEAEAEAYSLGLSEDTKRGMYDTAVKCQVTGPLPLGYVAGSDKKIKIEPSEAAIVRRAFDLYANGNSMPTICNLFNGEGLKTKQGKPWRVSGLSALFKNVKYIGIYKYKDVVTVEGGCPAIVSNDIFAEVQRKLSANSLGGRTSVDVDFLLSGKLFCGKCERPMLGDSGKNRTGTSYYYYSCAGKRKEKSCDLKSVKKDDIENIVFDTAINSLNTETIAQIAAETESESRKASNNQEVINSLKAELKQTEDEIKNIGKAIAAGIITETTKEMLETAEKYRHDINGRILAEEILRDNYVSAETVTSWLLKFKNGNKDDINFRRQVFEYLVYKVYVYDDYLIIWCNSDKNSGKKVTADVFVNRPKRGAIKDLSEQIIVFNSNLFAIVKKRSH